MTRLTASGRRGGAASGETMMRVESAAPGNPAPHIRTVGERALEVWLQINPDSDAAELLSVLDEEGVRVEPEDVESTFGEARAGTVYLLLPEDAVVAFVVRRSVVGLRRVGPTQTALLRGEEPPVPTQSPRLTRGGAGAVWWGPKTLPKDRGELVALRDQARTVLKSLAPQDQRPVQCALARIKDALRVAPGQFGTPLPSRVDVLSQVVLRLLRHHLTPQEIEALAVAESRES